MAYRAAVVGASGYAGIELVRVLGNHPDFEMVAAISDSFAGTKISETYPAFAGFTDLEFIAQDDADFSSYDLVFLAVPHTASLAITPSLLSAGVDVIDLSADYRLKDAGIYEAWYATPHTSPELLEKVTFGLPELMRPQMLSAKVRHEAGEPVLVACAGCYPTATSLAAAPAIRNGWVDTSSIVVVDAISGVTGAGKKPSPRTHYCHADENLEAYNVGRHRHTPEIEQILGIPGRVLFTPHLAPLKRGLLSTVTMKASGSRPLPSTEELTEHYAAFYRDSPFVRVMPPNVLPQTSSVTGSNFAHIGVVTHEATGSIIALGAIDNLGKGAAHQAVQCANIIYGLAEDAGLAAIPAPV